MRIDHVLLENYGPHRRLEFEPSPRMTAIVGPVGSGKTTVLAAVEHLITGRSPLAGKKAEDICDRSGPKDVSRLVAVLAHGPHRLELVRGLRGSTTSLKLDGGTAVEGEDRVNEELARLVGPAYGLLADYAFIPQGQVGGFLTTTPAVRSAACAKLFGVGRAAEVHAALGDALRKLEVPARSAEVDTLRRELGDDREALAALRTRLDAYADLVDYDRAEDPDSILLASAEERERLARSYRALGEDLKQVLPEIEAADEAVEKGRSDVARLEARVAADAPAVAAAREALAAWSSHRRRLAALARLEARAAAIPADVPPPARPDDCADLGDDSPDGFMAGLIAAADEAQTLARFLGDLAGEACPTCGMPTADGVLTGRIADARTRYPAAAAALKRLEDRHRRTSAYDRDRAAWVLRDVDRYARLEELEADRAALGDDATPPAGSPGELQQLATAFDGLTSTLRDVRESTAMHAIELAAFEKEAARIRAARADLKAALPPAVPPADIDAAYGRLNAVTQRLGMRGELVGAIAAGEKALRAKAATLARLEAEEARGARARSARARLEAMRSACEHTALPREVVRRELRRLEAGINGLLDRFEAGFRVEAGDDLAFRARFHSGARAGTVQPAQRLSYGQKTLLAWAYWCEVNARFVGEAGQFCLDEPTYGLAGDNFACLDAAIAALRATADRRGLQCWLVTHEPALGRLFDKVVVLT